MKKIKTIFLIVLSTAVALSACNLPATQRANEVPLEGVLVSVSVATEYRTGPGTAYDLVGVLNPGQVVEVVGRSPDGNYFLVRDPGNPAALWWLKSEFATVTGDYLSLPISTPPPTPSQIAAPPPGCPTPIGGGPTPVSCSGPVGDAPSGSGCPTPIGGGPTPVSCSGPVGDAPSGSGCPTPLGGGPTPVSCSGPTDGSSSGSGCPTPIGGGPTPVSCSGPVGKPTKIQGGATPVPTPLK